jgi:hypothetical protein
MELGAWCKELKKQVVFGLFSLLPAPRFFERD